MSEVKAITCSRRMSPLAALNYLKYHLFLQQHKRSRLQHELEEVQYVIERICLELDLLEKEMRGKEGGGD